MGEVVVGWRAAGRLGGGGRKRWEGWTRGWVGKVGSVSNADARANPVRVHPVELGSVSVAFGCGRALSGRVGRVGNGVVGGRARLGSVSVAFGCGRALSARVGHGGTGVVGGRSRPARHRARVRAPARPRGAWQEAQRPRAFSKSAHPPRRWGSALVPSSASWPPWAVNSASTEVAPRTTADAETSSVPACWVQRPDQLIDAPARPPANKG